MLCLAACGKNIDGKYFMVDYIVDGESMMKEIGNVTVQLEVNGNTATLKGSGDSINDMEETLIVDTEKKTFTDNAGEVVTYIADSGKITLENGGVSMVFERQ